jgi:hypothetical protein
MFLATTRKTADLKVTWNLWQLDII